MVKQRIAVYIATAVAIISFLFIWTLRKEQDIVPFSVQITADGHTEIIYLMENAEGECCVFLPSYAHMENVQIKKTTDIQLVLNGVPIYDGMSCADYLGGTYDIEYTSFGKKQKRQITFMQSDGGATLFLDTKSGSMDFIHENKQNTESCSMHLYTDSGVKVCISDSATIHGRGNASWNKYDKKPYTITFAQEKDLLGMGKAKKWILLANSADHSHIRNKLVYDYAAQLGLLYSPQCEWVDLYINGKYAGLYLLSEKNEVHSERINIASEESFLVSIEPIERMEVQNIPYVQTDSLVTFRIHYPTNPSQNTMRRIKERLQSVENAILSESGVDLVSGKHFSQLTSIDSWVQSYLIDEVMGNLDGFAASRYFYFDSTGDQKIYAGPVWDYDLALGNDTDIYWSVTNPDVQILQRYAYDPQSDFVWTQELYERSWFQEKLIAAFEEEILPDVNRLLDEQIPEYANQIRSAAEMDRVRWLSAEDGSFDQSVMQVSDYLREHADFLKSIWIDNEQYCQVSVLEVGCDQFCSVPYGGRLTELPIIEDRETSNFIGWYYADTDESFDINKPITEDIEIYAKWEDKSSLKVKTVLKLAPLAVIAGLGLMLLVVDIRRGKRNR